jgi:hypothetical protein
VYGYTAATLGLRVSSDKSLLALILLLLYSVNLQVGVWPVAMVLQQDTTHKCTRHTNKTPRSIKTQYTTNAKQTIMGTQDIMSIMQ